MGLLDSVLGSVMGQMGQQGSAGTAGGLGAVLGELLANDGAHGGLGGLVEKFNQAGMGEVIGSWIGKGQNLPITAEQIQDVLGSGAIGGIAAKLGLDPAQVSGQLSEMLPGLIDKLTPHGQAPEGGLGNAGDLFGMLGGLMQKN